MKIAFLGDISLNDSYIQLYQKGVKPFDSIGEYLKSFDYVVGNLECLAQGDKGENELKKPRLKTTVETLNYLSEIGLNVVELAHNHVYDNLKDGFEKTISFLNSKNIQYLGASVNASQAKQPLILEKKGISICLLNYVSKDTNPNLPNDADVYVNWFQENSIISEIKKYKQQYNYVVLLLHWGGRLEGGKYPDWNQPKIAKSFIDAGADLIIGNHSHTIQPYEIYKEKYIFYSLGNFCFADIYFKNKKLEINEDTGKQSLIVAVDFKENYTEITHTFTLNQNLRICIDNSSYLKYNKSNIFFKIIESSKFFWNLYYYKYKYVDPVYYFLFGKNKNFVIQIRKLSLEKAVRFFKK